MSTQLAKPGFEACVHFVEPGAQAHPGMLLGCKIAQVSPAGQTVPQLPQLLLSPKTLASHPSTVLPLQSAYPFGG
jgi:hypothetical protein